MPLAALDDAEEIFCSALNAPQSQQIAPLFLSKTIKHKFLHVHLPTDPHPLWINGGGKQDTAGAVVLIELREPLTNGGMLCQWFPCSAIQPLAKLVQNDETLAPVDELKEFCCQIGRKITAFLLIEGGKIL